MLITAISIENFKRISSVRIEPEADRVLVLIGGQNAQGKTSTMDALTGAFGGKTALPADPVRHGCEEAEIVVELEGGKDGKLVIKRTIRADGESQLEVREDGVKVRSPQQLLDKLRGRFLDPLAFNAMAPAAQRAELLKLVGDADRLAELDRKRVKAFDKRTELGRDMKRAEGELARLPEVKPGSPIDVAALTLESTKIGEMVRGRDAVAARLAAANAAKATVDAEVKRAYEAVHEAERRQDEAIDALKAAETAWKNTTDVDTAEVRRDEILFELRRATAHNAEVAAAIGAAKRRAEADAEATRLRTEVETCAAAITEIDERKAAILAAASLPVEGLGIDNDGVTLHGIALAQASGAERLRVALALAIAASPNVRDVWIRDGALLDDDSLDLVAKHAAAAGCRVWVERVGTRDPGAIVIHDGRVVS